MEETKAGSASDHLKQADEPSRTEPKAVSHVEDAGNAPDPDEDDLDDLDDMLDDFSTVKLNPKADAQKPSATAPAAAASASASTGAATDMQAQFENIFKGLAAGASAGSSDEPASIPKSAGEMSEEPSQDASFQETIKRTMARMQASGDQATAAATAEGSEDDFIAEMMKAMKDMPGGGEGSEEDFSKLLMGMMEQLTNKEILYEPMKELNDKYPGWMEKNKATLAKDDLKRYQEQQVLVAEMVSKFEEPTYSDSNAADREYIVDRMQKMQAAGSPPHDLVGDMPSAKEVLDAPDESCAPQ
ncbi:hypothetical protein RRF57_007843 [Xylaria bambusicola]|uniref:Uncharacterized protein n=1 Tax=Xylaria bambusicola TaxID=326684 RepID=A0AAN7UW04_9PEZI